MYVFIYLNDEPSSTALVLNLVSAPSAGASQFSEVELGRPSWPSFIYANARNWNRELSRYLPYTTRQLREHEYADGLVDSAHIPAFNAYLLEPCPRKRSRWIWLVSLTGNAFIRIRGMYYWSGCSHWCIVREEFSQQAANILVLVLFYYAPQQVGR